MALTFPRLSSESDFDSHAILLPRKRGTLGTRHIHCPSKPPRPPPPPA